MPITDLSDDALQHAIQTVGWPAAYRLGRVSRQFLRACQRCPNWVAAERSRLRSHGAHLRGFVLKLRIAISIVTDKTPNPPQFVPWEERPRDKRFKKLSETHFEESFESELDVEAVLRIARADVQRFGADDEDFTDRFVLACIGIYSGGTGLKARGEDAVSVKVRYCQCRRCQHCIPTPVGALVSRLL